MSCCGPKPSAPAQQAKPTPEKTATSKGEAGGCCGGGKAHADAQPEASQGARSGAGHSHSH